MAQRVGQFRRQADRYIIVHRISGQVCQRSHQHGRPGINVADRGGRFDGDVLIPWQLFTKCWHIGALGDVDSSWIILAGGQIIPLNCPPQSAGLYAHHRIDTLVKVRPAAENLGRHGVALDLVGFAGQGLVHDKFKKGGLLRRGAEIRAAQHALELMGNYLMRERMI